MSVPAHLRYTADHEWLDLADGTARVGVTAHATGALGEIVYLDLPEVGARIVAGTVCGEIESTKSVSELFAPVSGRVTAVNAAAAADPALVNHDPYGTGWLFVVEPTGDDHELLDAAAYLALVGDR